jgi:MFS family permease
VEIERGELITKRRSVFNVLFISVFSAILGLGIVAPFLPEYAESLGATGIWIGLIFSGFSFSRAVFMPVIGRISDRHGKKKFILIGLFAYTVISIAYTFADSVYSLTLVRFVHGFASAMVIPLAMAYIGEISPEGEEGRYMGSFMISLFLGMGFGPLTGGILNDLLGMNHAFYAMGILSAISFAICLLFLPEAEIRIPKQNFGEILKNRVVRSLLIFRSFNALGMAAIMAFLPIYASKINLSSSEVGIILAANVLVSGFLQRPFGKLADRRDRVYMIVFGSTIYALALAAIPLTTTFTDVLAIATLMGIGGAISLPAATAMVVSEGRELGHGSVMGLFNMAMSVGMIVAPLLSGTVMDLLGIEEVFLISAILSIGGLVAFYATLRL